MRVLLLVALLAAYSVAAFSQHPLRGTVTDAPGAAIPSALVLIHWDSVHADTGLSSNVGIKTDLALHTDEHGRFEAALPPGFYDVFVSAKAFTPFCRKIRIVTAPPKEMKIRMEVDALVIKEIADYFESPPPRK